MKRCLAVLLSALLLMTSAPLVSADNIYNDDRFDWGEYACPHNNVEEVAEIPSTCTQQGRGGYTRCVDCKLLVAGSKEPLPLADHTYDLACDTDCNVCGAMREIVHAYSGVVTAPDCVNGGYTTYTCAVCGDSYVADKTSALGHTSEVVQGYAATCDKDGLTDGAKCSVCGEILIAQVAIPAKGHAYSGVVIAPDCVNGGYTTYTCTVCGDSYVAEHTDALEHNYVPLSAEPSTCDQDGFEKYYCTNCCDSYTVTIPAKGHAYSGVVTAPDCVNGGYTTYTCAVCGDSYVADRTPATGEHTYDNDKDADCNVCGHVRPMSVPGDANGDGKVNNKDLGLLQQHLNEWNVEINLDAMDVDDNGRVNNKDLGLIQQYLNEWDVVLK